MWRTYRGPITTVLIACATAAPIATAFASSCSAAGDGQHQLRVRTIPGPMNSAAMTRVRAEVDAIWHRYHVDVLWVQPQVSDQQVIADLVVEVVEGRFPPAGRHGRIAIARMKFQDGFPTHHIEVSNTAAAALLPEGRWAGGTRSLNDAPERLRTEALGRIVGRALAHELGHYLLGSLEHADRGLMRAVIDPESLVSPSTSFLTLADADIHALRAARVARCGALGKPSAP
jgi:hypothetical protein